jgi:hypothetical protein
VPTFHSVPVRSMTSTHTAVRGMRSGPGRHRFVGRRAERHRRRRRVPTPYACRDAGSRKSRASPATLTWNPDGSEWTSRVSRAWCRPRQRTGP